MSNQWETLDVAALLARRSQQEATASGNVGSYQVPLGGVLRRDYPDGVKDYNSCHGSEFCDLDAKFFFPDK